MPSSEPGVLSKPMEFRLGKRTEVCNCYRSSTAQAHRGMIDAKPV